MRDNSFLSHSLLSVFKNNDLGRRCNISKVGDTEEEKNHKNKWEKESW